MNVAVGIVGNTFGYGVWYGAFDSTRNSATRCYVKPALLTNMVYRAHCVLTINVDDKALTRDLDYMADSTVFDTRQKKNNSF